MPIFSTFTYNCLTFWKKEHIHHHFNRSGLNNWLLTIEFYINLTKAFIPIQKPFWQLIRVISVSWRVVGQEMILTSFCSLPWLLSLLLWSCLPSKYWLVCWRGTAVSVLQGKPSLAQQPHWRVWYSGWKSGASACTGRALLSPSADQTLGQIWSLQMSSIIGGVVFTHSAYLEKGPFPEHQRLPWLLEAWQDCAVWLQVVATPQITRKDLSQFHAFFPYQWAKLLPECISLCLVPCSCWTSVLDADSYIHWGFHRSHCIVEHSLYSTMERQHTQTYHKVFAYRSLSNLESQ